MTEKLKTLSDLATKDGPIYNRFKLSFETWSKIYKKRNAQGDDCVLKFIKYFGEQSEEKNGE